MTHYVSFSGGADSTALAILLHERGEEFTLLFADTGAELPETYWIIPRVAQALGKRLMVVSGGTFYQHLVNRNFFLPSPRARWCTTELKVRPLNAVTQGDHLVSVGVRADEAHRMPDAHRPLVDAGICKADARRLCQKYDLLNPCYKWRTNCSCFCCPFQRKQDWLNLRREHPDLYALAEDWEMQSQRASANTRFTWNDSFTLRHLREADAAQLALWPEPAEEACAICQW